MADRKQICSTKLNKYILFINHFLTTVFTVLHKNKKENKRSEIVTDFLFNVLLLDVLRSHLKMITLHNIKLSGVELSMKRSRLGN